MESIRDLLRGLFLELLPSARRPLGPVDLPAASHALESGRRPLTDVSTRFDGLPQASRREDRGPALGPMSRGWHSGAEPPGAPGRLDERARSRRASRY